MQSSLAGLLPGLEPVRLGYPQPGEFAQIGDTVVKDFQGQAVVVKPLDGWSLHYDIVSNSYRPVKVLKNKRTFSIVAECSTEEEISHLELLCGKTPTLVSMTETTA